jgi:hypothetical protein
MKSFQLPGFQKQLFALLITFILFFSACNNQEKKTTVTNEDSTITSTGKKVSGKDTSVPADKKSTEKIKTVTPKIEGKRYFNDIARLIAGLPQEKESNLDSFQESASWKKYSQSIASNWASLSYRQLKPMKTWGNTELKDTRENSETVFYPFSGPDIMNAFTFFPHAQKYVMIGLEPVGSVPNLNNTPADSMNKYYAIMNTSLYSILNFSFFRTNSMAVDLKNEEIDGTLPLMLVFLARTGNKILDVHYVTLNENGEAQVAAQAGGKPKTRYNGVEIIFENNGEQKSAYYFSTNLADDYFRKNTKLISFIKNLENPVTYLKSASYLMHKTYFSVIRNLILEESKYVLQDDSGIPLSYFGSNKWDLQLYGTYKKPIDLFAVHYQEDMFQAYQADSVKPLPFGIGYNWRVTTSNLQLAKKKQE